MTRARVRAPELRGRQGWLNTGDRELSLADLRGKVVLLDFWTFCCVNCLHVLDELRPLEEKYAAFRTATAALPDATRQHYGGRAVVLELVPTEPPVTWDNAKLELREP